MTPLDTFNLQDEYLLNVSQALVHTLFLQFGEGTAATERIGRLPLRNIGKGTEDEPVINSSLPLNHSRRIVVSYKPKYVHKVLVNCLFKLAQEKKCG